MRNHTSCSSVAVLPALLVLGLLASACETSTPPRGPGSIFISASASLVEPQNFFQYSITVDDGSPRTAMAFENLSYVVNGLAHGAHKVRISGLPTMCNAGATQRDVNLRGDDTALVVFNIQCTRITGDLKVVVATTGNDPDTDGYVIMIDGFPALSSPPNGQVTLQFLPAGQHSVGLGDVSSNCAVSGPQSASITSGNLTTLNYSVSCAPVAIVKLAANATGDDRDVDGYTFQLGSSVSQRVTNGTSYLRVPSGTHTWNLGDVQPNCTLSGGASGSFTVAPGDTVTIDASATCSAIGYGTAGTVATDAEADTLQNASNNSSKAHDVVQFTTRYATNWLILVMRFKQPVGSVGMQSPAGLQGLIELDVDENTSTGVSPLVNGFGGNSQQGVDYGLVLFEADANSVRLQKVQTSEQTEHRVPFKVEGDSVVVRIPLAKLGGDDGNMTITSIVGTQDRPTDLLPNNGVILARPASAAIASAIVGADAPAPTAVRKPVKWGPR